MNTALIKNQDTDIVLWDDEQKLQEIRKLFAPKLSDMEFKFFVGLGKASRLNPFTREIWAVKYQENAPAQVFIGRDGYRKAAQAHNDYDFHQCDAVYENDEFQVTNGEVSHKYKLTNRGALIGAYCIAKRHKSSRPMYVFTELKEYSTGKSLWNNQTGKPATMIKKVAESQCLRACFQDLLGGTYGEEEMPQQVNECRVINGTTQVEKLKNMLGIGENQNDDANNNRNVDVSVIEPDNAELSIVSTAEAIEGNNTESHEMVGDNQSGKRELRISKRQLEEIHSLLIIKDLDKERIQKALNYYKVENLEDLNSNQAESFLYQLEKIQ